MLKIDNNYGISADSNSYSLIRMQDSTNKDTGETKEVQINLGYYTSIESALKGYIKAEIRKDIANEDIREIKELIKKVQELEKTVENFKY